MKPAILQWRVFIALLAIVIGAVSLASALGPNQSNATSVRIFYTSGINRVPAGRSEGLGLLPTAQSADFRDVIVQFLIQAVTRGGTARVGGWTYYVPHPRPRVIGSSGHRDGGR